MKRLCLLLAMAGSAALAQQPRGGIPVSLSCSSCDLVDKSITLTAASGANALILTSGAKICLDAACTTSLSVSGNDLLTTAAPGTGALNANNLKVFTSTQLGQAAVAGVINGLTIAGGTTGNPATITAAGASSDAAVGIDLGGKGTGSLRWDVNKFTVDSTGVATLANSIDIGGAAFFNSQRSHSGGSTAVNLCGAGSGDTGACNVGNNTGGAKIGDSLANTLTLLGGATGVAITATTTGSDANTHFAVSNKGAGGFGLPSVADASLLACQTSRDATHYGKGDSIFASTTNAIKTCDGTTLQTVTFSGSAPSLPVPLAASGLVVMAAATKLGGYGLPGCNSVGTGRAFTMTAANFDITVAGGGGAANTIVTATDGANTCTFTLPCNAAPPGGSNAAGTNRIAAVNGAGTGCAYPASACITYSVTTGGCTATQPTGDFAPEGTWQ